MEKTPEIKNVVDVDLEKGEGEQKERPSMSALLAMPAFLAALTACSDVVDTKNITEAIKSGEHVEYVSGKALEDLKTSIPALRAQFQGGKSVNVEDDNGDEIGIYFPDENVLVIAINRYKKPEDRLTYKNSKYNDRSYSFQADGTVLLRHGIRLQGPDGGYTNDRTVLQEHDGKYVVSFSQIHDYGPKRTYEIGKYKYNDAVGSKTIEYDLEEDNKRVAKALAK